MALLLFPLFKPSEAAVIYCHMRGSLPSTGFDWHISLGYNWSCTRAPGSSNGRTADFGSVGWGSNPCPGTNHLCICKASE